MVFDPDHQAIEQERQRWVYTEIDKTSELIRDLTVDPRKEYARHRAAYEQGGDPVELAIMLEYVCL